jgi:hypothetical protein
MKKAWRLFKGRILLVGGLCLLAGATLSALAAACLLEHPSPSPAYLIGCALLGLPLAAPVTALVAALVASFASMDGVETGRFASDSPNGGPARNEQLDNIAVYGNTLGVYGSSGNEATGVLN